MELRKVWASPVLARIVPYIAVVILTVAQDLPGLGRYWTYLLKLLVGAWCIWEMRRVIPELRWAISWEAVLAGVLVFVLWVGLDPFYPKIGLLFTEGKAWNPFETYGRDSAMAWFFAAVRIFGSALIIPPIEEAFYRSFLYRYFIRIDFTSLPLNYRHGLSWVVTSLIFGLCHPQWLSGILCGMAYQWLVIRKNRLGDAMTAHAITNFLLGVWIVAKGDWKFW